MILYSSGSVHHSERAMSAGCGHDWGREGPPTTFKGIKDSDDALLAMRAITRPSNRSTGHPLQPLILVCQPAVQQPPSMWCRLLLT